MLAVGRFVLRCWCFLRLALLTLPPLPRLCFVCHGAACRVRHYCAPTPPVVPSRALSRLCVCLWFCAGPRGLSIHWRLPFVLLSHNCCPLNSVHIPSSFLFLFLFFNCLPAVACRLFACLLCVCIASHSHLLFRLAFTCFAVIQVPCFLKVARTNEQGRTLTGSRFQGALLAHALVCCVYVWCMHLPPPPLNFFLAGEMRNIDVPTPIFSPWGKTNLNYNSLIASPSSSSQLCCCWATDSHACRNAHTPPFVCLFVFQLMEASLEVAWPSPFCLDCTTCLWTCARLPFPPPSSFVCFFELKNGSIATNEIILDQSYPLPAASQTVLRG